MVMTLKVLGSSSKGNCYLLDDGKEALMIECGIAFVDVQKAVNFDIARIVGCLISHEHGDHAKFIDKVLKMRIPCFASEGTLRAKDVWGNRLAHALTELHTYKISERFAVMPFKTQHDAAEPFGYLIHHPECGNVLFATDTYFLQYTFPGLNNILLECNYRQDILDANVEAGLLPKALRRRTMTSHCSFQTCKEILAANDLSEVNNIVLIHLSDGNSNAAEFKADIEAETGKVVHIATPGMMINFDKVPF